MTDEEKKEYREKLIADFKTYNHIDYDDDTEIIELLLDTVLEELGQEYRENPARSVGDETHAPGHQIDRFTVL